MRRNFSFEEKCQNLWIDAYKIGAGKGVIATRYANDVLEEFKKTFGKVKVNANVTKTEEVKEPAWKVSDERIKRYMTDFGHPNSQSLYDTFKKYEEIVRGSFIFYENGAIFMNVIEKTLKDFGLDNISKKERLTKLFFWFTTEVIHEIKGKLQRVKVNGDGSATVFSEDL